MKETRKKIEQAPKKDKLPGPTPEQLLKFKPLLAKDIDYDTPAANAEISGCKVVLSQDGHDWQLIDAPARAYLRTFRDTDKDKRVDVWIYYKAGRECYLEIDTDGDGKPDLAVAPTRWRHKDLGGTRYGCRYDSSDFEINPRCSRKY